VLTLPPSNKNTDNNGEARISAYSTRPVRLPWRKTANHWGFLSVRRVTGKTGTLHEDAPQWMTISLLINSAARKPVVHERRAMRCTESMATD
jgi:hypothetical protein